VKHVLRLVRDHLQADAVCQDEGGRYPGFCVDFMVVSYALQLVNDSELQPATPGPPEVTNATTHARI
jgi:hypothetical protein